MSNSEDLKRLNAGEFDLSHCDFSGANFAGRPLSRRDFTRANLQRVQAQAADFRDSDFTGATFQHFDARDAEFARAKFAGPIPLVNFFAAKLRDVTFANCSFGEVDFSKADIRGANFTNAIFQDGIKFDGAIFDESTLFDGASAMRAMASLSVFEHYDYVRGHFVRKKASSEREPEPKAPSAIWIARSPQILSEVQKAEGAISGVRAALPVAYAYITGEDSPVAGIGHNRPPPDLVITPQDIEEISASVDVLRSQVNRQPDLYLIKLAYFSIARVGAITRWLGEQSKVFLEETVKGAGARAGERLVDLASLKVALIILSGALAALYELLHPILKALGFP